MMSAMPLTSGPNTLPTVTLFKMSTGLSKVTTALPTLVDLPQPAPFEITTGETEPSPDATLFLESTHSKPGKREWLIDQFSQTLAVDHLV